MTKAVRERIQRNLRQSHMLSHMLGLGVDAASFAYKKKASEDDARVVVQKIMDDRVREIIADAKEKPAYKAGEEFNVRVSEARVAAKQAMRHLFPPAEEE